MVGERGAFECWEHVVLVMREPPGIEERGEEGGARVRAATLKRVSPARRASSARRPGRDGGDRWAPPPPDGQRGDPPIGETLLKEAAQGRHVRPSSRDQRCATQPPRALQRTARRLSPHGVCGARWGGGLKPNFHPPVTKRINLHVIVLSMSQL